MLLSELVFADCQYDAYIGNDLFSDCYWLGYHTTLLGPGCSIADSMTTLFLFGWKWTEFNQKIDLSCSRCKL